MKNLIFYYISILLPLPLMLLTTKTDSMLFTMLLILYLVYRSIVDGQRLLKKGLLKSNEFWKSFIPLYKMKYFKELYFEY